MAELGVHSIRINRTDGEAEVEILLAAGIPGGRALHRVGPDEIPDDIARALRRWLGYIDVPDKGEHRA